MTSDKLQIKTLERLSRRDKSIPTRFSNEGGADIGGLINGETYYVIIDANDPTHLKLAASQDDALGGIAIAIGAMVDAAIVMIETVHKKMEDPSYDPRRHWSTVLFVRTYFSGAWFKAVIPTR